MRISRNGEAMLTGQYASFVHPGAVSGLRSILVVADLSTHESLAMQRASQLADMHDANVKLVYMPERLEDLLAQTQGMDLVVMPHWHERSVAAHLRGQTVERLLRQCASPVLVVRNAGGSHYARALVAVDFAPASAKLVEVAARLDTRAQLEVFHAISTRNESLLRSAEATEAAVRAYRERCLQHARERMVSFTDSLDARRNRLLTTLGRGDAGRQTVIQQQRSGADLVVVGKPVATAWEDFLRPGVAQRVLRWGTSDLLIVPQPRAEAPAAAVVPSTGGQHARA